MRVLALVWLSVAPALAQGPGLDAARTAKTKTGPLFECLARQLAVWKPVCHWQVEAVRRNLCRAEEGEVRRQIVEVVETTPTVPSGYNVEEYADSLIQTTRLMAGWDFTRTDDFRRQADANCLYQMRGP